MPEPGPVTVRAVTHEILRAAGITTFFGNPGSNELPFLVDLPEDLHYVLGLHEGVVVGMADGYAQASGRLGLANLHSASGTGNAMGALTNSAISRTPLVVLAGQQARSTVGQQVMLANTDASQLTRPLTGFSAEPLSADDVPRTVAEAVHETTVARTGPAYVSVPWDDWAHPAPVGSELLADRVVTRAAHPAPEDLDALAETLGAAHSPALVVGSDLDGCVPMSALVALAESLEADVWLAPSPYRLPFPNRHRLFRGVLPAGIGSVNRALQGRDLVLALGTPVFRYHQWEPGPYLPDGTHVVQVTDDASAAARAPFGRALVADPAAVVTGLLSRRGVSATPVENDDEATARWVPAPPAARSDDGRLHPAEVFAALRDTQPRDTTYVVESTSTNTAWWQQMDLRHAHSYFFPASGGLGFGMPATIGVALALPERRVVGVVGDGSANYGITALWTAAQLGLPVTWVVLRNSTYGALRWFADLLDTPDVPGLDVPGIDFVALAEGYGVAGTSVKDLAGLEHELRHPPDGPRLIQVDTCPTTPT